MANRIWNLLVLINAKYSTLTKVDTILAIMVVQKSLKE